MFSRNAGILAKLGLGALAVLFISSCGNDDTPDPGPGYEVPATYNFEDVDYSGQTTRIMMLDEMKAEMSKGTSDEVNATVLKNMYRNENSPFTDAELNAATSKQLKDKTMEADQNDFEALMDSLADASVSHASVAAPGSAGVVTSPFDPNKKYLVSGNGFEYAQIIQKGIMGATFYYQAVESYLSEAKIGDAVDNTTVTPGKGTPMEHHWDEAFGYLGVPEDFPTNTSGAKYWGSYTRSNGAKIGADTKLMNAFITGRAAISNKDMATKDAQIAIVKEQWERVAAASAIHYLNTAKASWTDDAVKAHVLSEAIGFILALKYNGESAISTTQVMEVLESLNFDGQELKPAGSLWDVTEEDVNSAITTLNSVYNFDNVNSL